jgi:hypothetical protein
LLTWSVGCGGSAPPASPEASPQTGYAVSGTVTETVDGSARPLAGQLLRVFVWETENLPAGLTLRGTVRDVTTDAQGRYLTSVPKSKVFVNAWAKRQPCLATALVTGDTILDVSTGAFDSPSAGPMITGVVYEATPDGRRPLKGASAWLDISQDAYVAHTVSDETGRFFFCHVDTLVRLDVSADGYQPYQHAEFFSGVGDRTYEFEFTR